MASLDAVGDSFVGPSGFDELFESHFGSLVGLARLLGSDDPEDTAAEAFVRLHENWATLRDVNAALPYVRATVVRLCSNRRRHLTVVDRHARRQQPGTHPSAEETALQRDRDDTLLAALAGLTVARQAAVVLRHYAGLPFEEIGRALGCRTSTARSHAARGLADLRRTWHGEDEGV